MRQPPRSQRENAEHPFISHHDPPGGPCGASWRALSSAPDHGGCKSPEERYTNAGDGNYLPRRLSSGIRGDRSDTLLLGAPWRPLMKVLMLCQGLKAQRQGWRVREACARASVSEKTLSPEA